MIYKTISIMLFFALTPTICFAKTKSEKPPIPILKKIQKENKKEKDKKNDVISLKKKQQIKSLFFLQKDFEKLQKAIDEFDRSNKTKSSESEQNKKPKAIYIEAKIFLSSIFYADEKTWTIWINGKKISSLKDDNKYKISKITPKYIVISSPTEKEIKLFPNQTYDLTSGKVFEGRLD